MPRNFPAYGILIALAVSKIVGALWIFPREVGEFLIWLAGALLAVGVGIILILTRHGLLVVVGLALFVVAFLVAWHAFSIAFSQISEPLTL